VDSGFVAWRDVGTVDRKQPQRATTVGCVLLLRWRIDETEEVGGLDQAGEAVHGHPAHGILAMLADGEGADPELARDLLAGKAHDDEPHDVEFARAQVGLGVT
jgi:hypothetical protein